MKKIEWRFPLQVGVTFCVIAAVAAYPLLKWGSAAVATAALVGGVLSTCNVLLGFMMIEYGFEKSYTTFLKAVLGGMGIRMAFMLGALLILILACHMHAVALTVTVVLFTMVYLVLEIFYLHRKVDVKNLG
jgi:phage-related holin